MLLPTIQRENVRFSRLKPGDKIPARGAQVKSNFSIRRINVFDGDPTRIVIPSPFDDSERKENMLRASEEQSIGSVVSCAAASVTAPVTVGMRRNWHEQVHHGTGGHVLPGIHHRLHGSGKRSRCAGTFGYRVGADDHGLRGRTHLGRALQPGGNTGSVVEGEV